MTGDEHAITRRSLPLSPHRRWSTWIARMSEERRRARQERLETLERLESEQRRGRRAGEYRPDPVHLRRWS
jgi:hypothetical protein